MRRVVLLLLIVGIALAYHFGRVPSVADRSEAVESDAPERAARRVPIAAETFTCEGKTRCREMRSCAEATFYLAHCPGVKIDGDNDGVPCESQWCGGDAE